MFGLCVGIIFTGLILLAGVSIAMRNVGFETGSFVILYGFATICFAYFIFVSSYLG